MLSQRARVEKEAPPFDLKYKCKIQNSNANTKLEIQNTKSINLSTSVRYCSIQYFTPNLSANSTPFNPQSGPREAQWKPYDLPLFLTPPPFPPLQSGLIWSTLDLSAYLLLSRVDGERPVGLHPGSLAGVLLPVGDEPEGDGGDEGVT